VKTGPGMITREATCHPVGTLDDNADPDPGSPWAKAS
jgi:hypothetical protein